MKTVAIKIGSILLALLLAASAWAGSSIVSEKPDDTEVVIYRFDAGESHQQRESSSESDGIALITEAREVELPAGRSTIVFRRTAEAIIPQTAKLLGLPGGVVEANFDYNLLSRAALVAASVDKSVRVVRTQRGTSLRSEERAVIRSGPSGIVLEFADRIEAFGCSGLNESIVFDELPPALVAEPSLSVQVDVPKAGRYPVRLSYLATGFGWSADYVARLNADGRSLDLSGWITLSNRTSTNFPNAVVKVVAGNLSLDDDTTASHQARPGYVDAQCWPTYASYILMRPNDSSDYVTTSAIASPASARVLQEVVVMAQKKSEAVSSELGDYKLYSLPGRTDLSANQTKQVAFLDKQGVRSERVYRYIVDPHREAGDDEKIPVYVLLKLDNKAVNGLGVPLPMGTVATFDVDPSGQAIFAGEQWIQDAAIGAPIQVFISEALDVSTSFRMLGSKKVDSWWRRYDEAEVEITVANTKPVAVRIEVELDQEVYNELKIAQESQSHGRRAGKLVWTYDLQPEQREVLRLMLRKSLDED